MSEVWNGIAELVRSAGLELFDIEVPRPGPGGVLRVYIAQPEGAPDKAIHHTHCVAVTHKLLDWQDLERLVPGNCNIEVSSPGINRKLTRPEHFKGAQGEHVKLKLRQAIDGEYTWRGKLESFDGQTVKLSVEGKAEPLVVPTENVSQARVDFQF
ncbi:MAG: ribosome maturation factor RimP [Oligoflexia bacterium]|nr:ribosome maturation factor RimP [Oligoflexia bacterium]